MTINYLILLTLIFIFLMFNTIKIFIVTKGFFPTLIEVIAYWSLAILILHFFGCVYVFYNVRDLKGKDGPKGLKGPPGKSGKDGRCAADCGQKVCNSLIVGELTQYLKKKKVNLSNQLLIKKANKVCFSDNYLGLLYTRHKNRPNEKKIIEYSTKLFKNWADIILKHKRGKEFLESPQAQENFFKRNSPFDEIRKYDIYHWGDPYRIRPIVRIQCAKEATLPKGDRDLFGYYTSDYGNPIFTTEMKKGVYGPSDCPYEQLGVDRTNPRNITRCYYSQNQGISNTRSVYLEVDYKPFSKPFSFYNTAPFINDKNQQFYPCGTNWRGRVDKEKPMDKYTILLSGKTMPPKDYRLIWNSVNGCEGCMLPENEVSIWRPIAEEGFVSLGDVVVRGINKPALDMIRTIPIEYAVRVEYKHKVWGSDGFQKQQLKSDGTVDSRSSLRPLSVWAIGFNNLEEEAINYPNKKIRPAPSYSFFRANNGQVKPSEPAYIINKKFLAELNTPLMKGENTLLGFGWLGGEPRKPKYSVFNYLGYSTNAIVTNTDASNSPDGIGKSFYLENAQENDYFLKAYEKTSGEFNLYYTLNGDNEMVTTERRAKNNNNQLFRMELVFNDKNEVKKQDGFPLVILKNVGSGKYLIQSFNNEGISSVRCEPTDIGSIFKFQSFNGNNFST